LRAANAFDDGSHVSPLAQTVPLSSEGLTTSNLGADELGGSASETGRVARAEMEQLFRRSRLQVEADGNKDAMGSVVINSDYAAPPTGELTPPALLPVATPHAQTSGRTRPGRSRAFWALMTGLLLAATVSGALLVYYFLRRPAPQIVSGVKAEGSGNQAVAPANANSTVEESGVHAAAPEPTAETPLETQQTTEPKPKPSASVEPTRDARPRPEQTRPTEATLPDAATPKPTPTASPTLAQTTPTQTPVSQPTGGSSNKETVNEASSDVFFFQAVNLVNGRDPHQLKRAELLRALQLFQNVKSGPNLAEARRQAARLGKELDRLNKQSQR
jgi:outer membrane biosynthesis protein TonB